MTHMITPSPRIRDCIHANLRVPLPVSFAQIGTSEFPLLNLLLETFIANRESCFEHQRQPVDERIQLLTRASRQSRKTWAQLECECQLQMWRARPFTCCGRPQRTPTRIRTISINQVNVHFSVSPTIRPSNSRCDSIDCFLRKFFPWDSGRCDNAADPKSFSFLFAHTRLTAYQYV